jgi:hypothetical protein
MISEDKNISKPIVKPKNNFEEALDKLDLQGLLLLMTVLSEKALYLQSISLLEKPKVLKPEKKLIHA